MSWRQLWFVTVVWAAAALLCPTSCSGASCKPGFEVECKVTGKCISSSLVCNGQHDCGSGDTSDESGCPAPSCISGHQVSCDDGKCIEADWECDGAEDCADGSDEAVQRCTPTMPPPCDDQQFYCGARGADGCISKTRQCDGFPDCDDGSDETGCATPTPPVFPSPDPTIYFAYFHEIRNTTVDGTHVGSFKSSLKDPEALDFHWGRKMLYWSDNFEDKIYGMSLEIAGNLKTVVSGSLGRVAGLCVDWVHDYLIWTDEDRDKIERYDIKSNQRSTLIDTGLHSPRGIVVDPLDGPGYVYFGDWGNDPKIEKMTVDGNNRQTLVDDDTVVGYPNGLAIDYQERLLFWADGKDKRIMSCGLNGENVKVVRSSLGHPFGLALLGDWLFWTDWKENSIIRMNKQGRYKYTVLGQLTSATVKDIKIVHPLQQPERSMVNTVSPPGSEPPKPNGGDNIIVDNKPHTNNPLSTNRQGNNLLSTERPGTSAAQSSGSSNMGLIGGVVGGAVLLLILIAAVAVYIHLNRKKGEMSIDNPTHMGRDLDSCHEPAAIIIESHFPQEEKDALPGLTDGLTKHNGGTSV